MNNNGTLAISLVCCAGPIFFMFCGWVARGIALKGYRLRSPLGKGDAIGYGVAPKNRPVPAAGAAVPPVRRQTETPVVPPSVTK